jgi:hypothetical protein
VTGGIMAMPQAATMLGIPLPAIGADLAIPAGVLGGLAGNRGPTFGPAAIRALRVVIVLGIVAGLTVAFVLASPAIGALFDAPGPFVEATAVLLVAAIAGAVMGVPAARSPVVLAGAGVGFAVAIATQLVPAHGSGLLGQAIRFELPKTIYYWIPVVVAIAAAATLEWLWRTDRLPWLAGVGAVGLWVVVAALPLRFEPIDAFHLGEHRFSEALAIDLREAGTGFWVGYPDRREIVDPPRREILDAVRVEIAAGRIGPDTPVLHIAGSFQQWVATPLGVFTGVTETDVSLDAEDSIHTIGGRLLHMEALPAQLASKAYPYLLLEPDPSLPPDLVTTIEQDGYVTIFSNDQGSLYRLGGG